MLIQPSRAVERWAGTDLGRRRQVIADVVEIHQIARLRSKYPFKLLSDPHRSVAHAMDVRLRVEPRTPSTGIELLAYLVGRAERGGKHGARRAERVDQAQARFLPSISAMSSIVGSALWALTMAPFVSRSLNA